MTEQELKLEIVMLQTAQTELREQLADAALQMAGMLPTLDGVTKKMHAALLAMRKEGLARPSQARIADSVAATELAALQGRHKKLEDFAEEQAAELQALRTELAESSKAVAILTTSNDEMKAREVTRLANSEKLITKLRQLQQKSKT